MGTTVFVSHAATDIELVRKVEAHAKLLDIAIYTYEDDPQGGRSVAEKLLRQIREADALVVLLTKSSQNRPSVHAEVGAAKSLGKAIIPIIETGVDPHQFVFLQGLEWVTLDLSAAENALLHLQKSLKRLRDSARDNAITIGAVLLFLSLLIFLWAKSKDA